MATIKITNGFLDLQKKGEHIILTGILLSGEIKRGDFLLIDNETKVPISKVELDSNISIKTIHVRLFIPEENKVVWHKLYNNIFETKTPS